MSDTQAPVAALPRRGVSDVAGVTRRHLADGHWLDLRNELTAGDASDVRECAYGIVFTIADGMTRVFRPAWFELAQVAAYITAWSLIDLAGAPIDWPVVGPHATAAEKLGVLQQRVDILRSALRPEDYREIRKVVDAHDDAMEAVYAEKKRFLSTGISAPPSSPSAS